MAKEISLGKAAKDLNKKILKKAEGKSILKAVANLLATTMRVRVRKGFGVRRDGGNKYRFGGLEASTKRARARQKKKGTLLSGEGVNRSNLTATGQLTNAIQGDSKPGQIIIEIEENRTDGARNADIEKGHETGNGPGKKRPFFHISKQEFKVMTADLRREIKKAIGRL